MSQQQADMAAVVEAQALAIGLPLDPAHLPGTIQNFSLIAMMAQAVMSFPMPPEVEPAPVFSHDKS